MKSVNSFNQVQQSTTPYRFAHPSPSILGKRVFLTGATGFIGQRLLNRLLSHQCYVTGTIRKSPPRIHRSNQSVSWVSCDLGRSDNTLGEAIEGCDYVFHLAAATRSTRSQNLVAKNVLAFRAVLDACAAARRPPKLVYVSSLAAVGPSIGNQLLTEEVPKRPVSYYGKSKAACENLAIEYAESFPISIVRPPIVLGPGDRNGFQLFNSIKRWRYHMVPGFRDHLFSVIHVDDLSTALIRVAELGRRISRDNPSQGIYFATGDSVLTYAGLGKQIGIAVGHTETKLLRVPKWSLRAVGAINDIISRITGKQTFLNHDKCREGTAGSWACSGTKLRTETGFRVSASFEQRLAETAEWYQREGWY